MALFQKSVLTNYLNSITDDEINSGWKKLQDYKSISNEIRNYKEEEFQFDFLKMVFNDCLGYKISDVGEEPRNLYTEVKNVSDSKKADGAIKKDDEVIAVIELKSTKTKDFNKIQEQAFGYKVNQPKCKYIITSNFEKLRFYINDATDYEDFDLFNLTKAEYKLLHLCLSKGNIFNDVPEKLKNESVLEEENITKKLYKDYSTFRNEIFNSLVETNSEYDKLLLFNKTQKLLDRFLFIFFAEDRNLVHANSISQIISKWEGDVAFGESRSLYSIFKQYFHILNVGRQAKGEHKAVFAYNGGLFANDAVLDKIEIDDAILLKHTKNLSHYDFESDISVNILGHIFEHSLSEIEEIQNEIVGIETDKSKSKRKKDGVFYTPSYITKYIVENTVGKLCKEKKTELEIDEEIYTQHKARSQKRIDNLNAYRDWLLGLTICDPACGSGAFLIQALNFLIDEHKYIDELNTAYHGSSIPFSDITSSILENNLYGADINEESVEIAKLSLWLRTAQKGRKLTSLNKNIKCGNSLIDDPKVAGDKSFNWQKEFPEVFNNGGFDVIIGNPPYVSSKGENFSELEKEYYIENYQCAVYQIDLYLLFNEKSLLISNQKSIISLIEPNAWMNNLFSKPIRKFLLDNTIIYEIVNTPIGVFKDATVDTVILTFSKKTETLFPIKILEAKGQDIIYLHSKDAISFANNENFDFDILVSQVVKQLVLKLETKKEYLIDISFASSGIKEYEKGKGNPPQSSEDVKSKPFNSKVKLDDSYQKHISGSDVSHYVLNWQGNYLKYGEWIAAPRNPIFFEGERLVIREIPGKKNLIVSYTSEKYTVKNTAHIFKVNNSEYSIFGLLGILNSKLMGFYFKNKFSEDDDVFPKAKIGQCKKLPISINLKNNISFDNSVKKIISLLGEFNVLSKKFSELVNSKFSVAKPSKKLQNWHDLDFGEFFKELTKNKVQLSLSEEAEWMQYFNEQKQKAQELKTKIEKTDKEIDQMVYELYGLTKEEIEIVENIK